MRRFVYSAAVLIWSGAALAGPETELAAPVRLEANGKLVDVEIGHAAPLVTDFDGDGKRDLLVGQFGEGKLRIYRNIGSDANPRFKDFSWFEAGGKVGKVPFG